MKLRPAWMFVCCVFALVCLPAFAAVAQTPVLHVATLDGKTFDLTAQRGRWVIVNFWATWCSPCVAEMPAISTFVEAHKNVTAIGLAFEDTDRKDVIAFLKQHPVHYPVALIDPSAPPKSFDVPRGLPTTYVIAPDGHLAKHFVGPIDAAALVRVIDSAGASKQK